MLRANRDKERNKPRKPTVPHPHKQLSPAKPAPPEKRRSQSQILHGPVVALAHRLISQLESLPGAE